MLYRNPAKMDYSTISREVMESLPVYTKPRTYKISDSAGSGCFLDAPGYPTYFLQHVYTQYGNTPATGPSVVIFDQWNGVYRAVNGKVRKLWVPVPMDSLRFKLWEIGVYQHQGAGYYNLDIPTDQRNRSANSLIFMPFSAWELSSLGYRPADDKDPRYSEEYKAAERERAAKQLAELEAHYAPMCTPDNMLPVLTIQRFYPDYAPNEHLMERAKTRSWVGFEYARAEWWEAYASAQQAREAYDKSTPWTYRQHNPFGLKPEDF